MSTSRKIVVVKRDGEYELFNTGKLAATVWRGVERTDGHYNDAIELARAVRIYLRRRAVVETSSRVIQDLMLRAMRKVNMNEAAVLVELHSILRDERRKDFTVLHEKGGSAEWDKSWVASLISRMWHISRIASRIIAGEIEMELLEQAGRVVKRGEVIKMLNAKVTQYGLADAVPVRQYEMEE